MFLNFCVLDDFFLFSKNSEFWVFLVYPTVVSVLRSASVERCFVSRMQDFFLHDGQGVGQGGADVSQLQDCGSVACGAGWRGDEFLARAGEGAGQDGGH